MPTDLQQLRIDPAMKSKRGGSRKWIWVVAILAIFLGIYLVAASRGRAAAVEMLKVTRPTGLVLESDVPVLTATGYIIAAHKIQVAAKVVGKVAWIGVEKGDHVDAGQVIVRLEDDEFKAGLMTQEGMLEAAKAKLDELIAGSRPEEILQSQALLDQAKVDVENAEITVNRYRGMPPNSISRQTLDDAEADLRSKRAKLDNAAQALALVKLGPRKEEIAAQRAAVKQMEGGVALAKVQLDSTVIRSPVAGTILDRNVEVGEFVTTGYSGDQGAKGYVVSLADLSDLKVELDVSQNDFAKVTLNQPCWVVTDAYADRKYGGVVDLLSPEANRSKATVLVRVKILSPDGFLRPDMNATVSFLDAAKLAEYDAFEASAPATRPAIRIPKTALRGDKVYVNDAGKVGVRSVKAGMTVGDEVEIVRGLLGGEEVIVHPAGLTEGDAVKSAAVGGK